MEQLGFRDRQVKVEEEQKLPLHEVDFAERKDGGVASPMFVLWRRVYTLRRVSRLVPPVAPMSRERERTIQVFCCHNESREKDPMSRRLHAVRHFW